MTFNHILHASNYYITPVLHIYSFYPSLYSSLKIVLMKIFRLIYHSMKLSMGNSKVGFCLIEAKEEKNLTHTTEKIQYFLRFKIWKKNDVAMNETIESGRDIHSQFIISRQICTSSFPQYLTIVRLLKMGWNLLNGRSWTEKKHEIHLMVSLSYWLSCFPPFSCSFTIHTKIPLPVTARSELEMQTFKL